MVGIITNDPLGIGSSSTIRWKDRGFILTAKHIFDLDLGASRRGIDPRNALYVVRPVTPVEITRTDFLSQAAAEVIPAYRLPITSVFDCTSHDLIVLELKDGADREFGFNYFSLDTALVTPTEGYLVNFTGHPHDLTTEAERRYNRVVMNAEWGNLENDVLPLEPVSNFFPDQHFIVRFRAGTEGRKLHGFSGSGVWWHEKPPLVWFPNLRLAGLVVEYYANPPRLKAIRTETIRKFLDSIFDLTSS